jgi:2-methylcitrate dehydratase PrpD
VTVAQELADRALRPVPAAAAERLRAVTLTNVAAGIGELGRAGELIGRIPLGGGTADVAFELGMRLHARTQDDFHPAGRIHVGAVTLAATLALADRAGDRLLDCLAAGYETMCAVAVRYSPEAQRRGARPTGVFGPIGAAASAGVALGLDRDGIANAIGLAAARSGGTMQSWLSGTDEWLLELGAAARAGVEAALFTEAGAVASPEAFEGSAGWAKAVFADDDVSLLREAIAAPGSYTNEVAVKPYPVSGIAQVPTDLARRAHEALQGREPRSVVVRLAEAEARYPGTTNRGPFQSRSAALMSVGFCIACALTDGTVRLERLERPNSLAELVGAVEIEVDDSLGESEAVLIVDAGDEVLELRGEGESLLFPSWESLVADAAVVAVRSEADPARVEGVLEPLGAARPDASAVGAPLTGWAA